MLIDEWMVGALKDRSISRERVMEMDIVEEGMVAWRYRGGKVHDTS